MPGLGRDTADRMGDALVEVAGTVMFSVRRVRRRPARFAAVRIALLYRLL
ncbi:MAG TPA: hypothetical protein VHH12_06540 [Mycobacterium sp.]|nr:hypothetical protein [Mycobacterium sp.]